MSVPMNQNARVTARIAAPISMTRGTRRGGLVGHILGRFLGAVRERKVVFATALLLSIFLAFNGAGLVSKKVWEAETTLVYAPLPVPDDGKGLYTPPDLKTLTALINSPENIEDLRRHFKLEVPGKAVDKNLTVLIPNGTKVVKLSFRWDDGPRGAEMLNRLAGVFVNGVAELRRNKLGEHVHDFEVNLAKTSARLDEASKAVRDFYRRNNLVDYHEDLILIKKEIMEFDASIAQQRRIESDTLAQAKRMTEHLAEVKAEDAKDVEHEKQFQASSESVADNRRRQDRLRELIGEEQRIQEVQAQLDVKTKEYDRVRKLVMKGAAPLAEADAIRAEIIVLNSRIKDTEKIRLWKAELEKIDKVVVPDGAKKNSGSPIIHQVLFRRLELELQLTAIREEIRQVEKGVGEKRKLLEKLDGLRGEYDSLTRKVEAINAERLQVESQIAGMKNLMSLSAGEFVVASRAEAGEFPVSSNKKLFLAGFGGLGVMLALGLVIVLEVTLAGWSPEGRGYQLGLPLLALISPVGEKARFQQLRGLALRLRQHVAEAGAVIVFSTLSDTGSANDTLGELAGFFALRDERILILDARVSHQEKTRDKLDGPDAKARAKRSRKSLAMASETPKAGEEVVLGLSDYLAFNCNHPDDICHPEEGYGVDRIRAGQAIVTADALATHRMAELILELRQNYSLILIIGPSLSQAVDLQILATMALGVVAVVDAPVPITREVRRTLDELNDLGAPILGQIVLGAAV